LLSDKFLRDLALLFIGAVVGPGIWRLIHVRAFKPFTVRLSDESSTTSHGSSVRMPRRNREMQKAAEHMNARGMLESSIHQAEEELGILWALEDEERSLIREFADAIDTLGIPERAYARWRLRKPINPRKEGVVMAETEKST
jgi:hypothetical protein